MRIMNASNFHRISVYLDDNISFKRLFLHMERQRQCSGRCKSVSTAWWHLLFYPDGEGGPRGRGRNQLKLPSLSFRQYVPQTKAVHGDEWFILILPTASQNVATNLLNSTIERRSGISVMLFEIMSRFQNVDHVDPGGTPRGIAIQFN